MEMLMTGPDMALPWTSTEEEDKRFRKILSFSLILFMAAAIVAPFLPVKEIPREQKEALPPQLASVILEKKVLPQPQPVKPPAMPKPQEKRTPPEATLKEKPKEQPKPAPQPIDRVKQAREKAAVSGLLAFQDDLAAMRDSVGLDESLSNKNLSRGEAKAVKMERSIITSKAKRSSGGIQTAALSRDTGGVAMSGKETAKVTSNFDQIARAQDSASDSAKAGGRSDESVRLIMDKNKGAIFAIYNRALREDPALQGTFTFEMLIEPDGTVSEIKLISSDLNQAELEQKILNRIRLIRFPAGNVIKTRVNYSFDFLSF